MRVNIRRIHSYRIQLREGDYAILARRAIEWFERAGDLALTVTILDSSSLSAPFNGGVDSDPTSVLFRALLSFSTRWEAFNFTSSHRTLPTSMIRIAALTAAHVPLLQSVSLRFEYRALNSVLHNSELFAIPTLRHVTLENVFPISTFAVNWPVLTSVTLHGEGKNKIGTFLQQTKCLEFCDIFVYCLDEDLRNGEISLPFLKTLIVSEENRNANQSGAHTILEAIIAPALEIFDTRVRFFDLSLSDFLERSPNIWKLSMLYFDEDILLTGTMKNLLHCPSLTTLYIWAHNWRNNTPTGDRFLRAFVEDGNDGVICPRLQDFTFAGKIDFSFETLRIFVGKKRDSATPNVLPWKKVDIGIGGVKFEEHQQILDFVSQKAAAGLDIRVNQ